MASLFNLNLSSLLPDFRNWPKALQDEFNKVSKLYYPSLATAAFGLALPPYLMQQFQQYSREPLQVYEGTTLPSMKGVRIPPYGRPGIYMGTRGAGIGFKTGDFTEDQGMYLTMNPKYAERYSSYGVFGKQENILHDAIAPVVKPLNLDDPLQRQYLVKLIASDRKLKKGATSIISQYDLINRNLIRDGIPQFLSSNVINKLRAAGYDAVYSSRESDGPYPTLIHLYPERVRLTPAGR